VGQALSPANLPTVPQFSRSATIGSTSIARRAGTSPAPATTAISAIAIPATIPGSTGLTPYKNLATRPDVIAIPANPIATPSSAGSSVSLTTIANTRTGVAPSARRIFRSPVSFAYAFRKLIHLVHEIYPVSLQECHHD
jgi:hypothetical protein